MTTLEKIREEILHWEKDSNEDDLYQLGAMDMQSYVLRVIDKYAEQEPTIEAYKQVCKERDIAIEQLHELGYEFGQKIEPCDDVVSRQAVLASIKNLYPDMPIMDIFGARRKWLDKYAPYFECENAVEQLPSVRPQEPKWIPISERLPEDNYAVLVWCPERKNNYCAYRAENQWWIFGAYSQKVLLEVLAWMPLPKPYEPQESEEK